MFNRLNQKELIQSLSKRELYLNLYLTQGIFLLLTVILSLFFQQDFADWIALLQPDWLRIIVWSTPVILLVVLVDLILWKKAPRHFIDDGGINERIFSDISLPHLILVAGIIGICEELLFRGLLQTNIGYVPASLLFALMHIRYITKPVLLLFAILLSFLLGAIFIITENLLIPILIHIGIDFLLGLIIRYNFLSVRSINDKRIDDGYRR
ncbi:CPBP family intramembrane glutamic endopeptidase [Pseudalkalibacillus salsuginis]|uniref:CPBP family intramembrane glutamic endopeptidase n=1 Tax=Pseudalkalibacillus salsuginis TaxID=2910972 RepID=UPI001F267AD6|nr:CPBP family intramembrane glutamic endopeptidase [Pseudalkalibacillus salsuginis]MCF6408263.1 CPBP family intramembrane metalloprotease [Pseudalkalibacillus salsuginis]